MSKKKSSDFEKKIDSLTPLQFEVTQKDGTEPPFENEYYDNTREGIYVDLVSGEALFSSTHKYKSGSGWPSFYQPIDPENLVKKSDQKLLRTRTEVRSKKADSHLGHVFDDGPAPTGKRYCINSAALRFIPKEKMAELGYKKYLVLFESDKNKLAESFFAGGCFWCVEADLEKIAGVIEVVSGYMGGDQKSANYEQVSQGQSEHVEAVKVIYDPNILTYENLLKAFWLNVDPRVKNRQFCDVGTQYQSKIFYRNQKEKEQIDNSLAWLKKEFALEKIETQIEKAKDFFDAEEYHQKYYKKNPIRYNFYRKSCGRDQTLKEIFGDKRESILEALKKK